MHACTTAQILGTEQEIDEPRRLFDGEYVVVAATVSEEGYILIPSSCCSVCERGLALRRNVAARRRSLEVTCITGSAQQP